MPASPNIKDYVIPLLLETEGGCVGGSAFLGSLGDDVYLVTAAHSATMLSSSPIRWDEWSPRVTVCAIDGGAREAFSVELFRTDSFGSRAPKFHYVNHPALSRHVVDLMLVPVNEQLHRLSRYPRINLEISAPPKVLDIVTTWGFPTEVDVWPTHQSTSGPAQHVPSDIPELLFVAMPSEVGYSGAPAFSSEGAFVGMVIGKTDDEFHAAQVIPPGFLRRALPHPGGDLTSGDYSSF